MHQRPKFYQLKELFCFFVALPETAYSFYLGDRAKISSVLEPLKGV
jgi:hypothetical protein